MNEALPTGSSEPPPGPPSGLPGGVALPAVLFVLSFASFVLAWIFRDVVHFGSAIGPRISPAGLGVLASVATFFWLLVAIAKRPPSP